MKLLLELNKDKVPFILELLKKYSFIKTTKIEDKDIAQWQMDEVEKRSRDYENNPEIFLSIDDLKNNIKLQE